MSTAARGRVTGYARGSGHCGISGFGPVLIEEPDTLREYSLTPIARATTKSRTPNEHMHGIRCWTGPAIDGVSVNNYYRESLLAVCL